MYQDVGRSDWALKVGSRNATMMGRRQARCAAASSHVSNATPPTSCVSLPIPKAGSFPIFAGAAQPNGTYTDYLCDLAKRSQLGLSRAVGSPAAALEFIDHLARLLDLYAVPNPWALESVMGEQDG